jgi:acetyl-CoA/propionyl-CoA carboxylase biotin carboxyl carrier protein
VIRVEVNDRLYRVRLLDLPRSLAGSGARRAAPRLNANKASSAKAGGDAILSPMHGIIVEINVVPGDSVSEGQVVGVIEAMKMMNEIRAHRNGTVARVHGGVGDAIESGAALVSLAETGIQGISTPQLKNRHTEDPR